ncbi:MAG: HAD family hydrolase [Alphaproteobacteria bacterium]|nr:HAD family hydrolase [Alphaproteobacteria bacterium]MDX5494145.1 HAD family hydrolase [Alphaproteobacteria bacterium]
MAENRQLRRPRGLLFDKDGTMFDYHRTWTPLLTEVAVRLAGGDRARGGEMLAAIGHSAETGRFRSGSIAAAGDTFALADTWMRYLDGIDRADLIAALDAHFAEAGPQRSIPVTDLAALFGRLKSSGFILGIATNDVEASALGTVERFGLDAYVDFVAGYDSGYGQKPGPGMALAFCEAVRLMPAEIAAIGDNSHDLEMGRGAGAGLGIGVLTGTSAREDLAPLADHVIESIVLLPALLDALEV